MSDLMAWCDIETTGLKMTDVTLEIGLAITTTDLDVVKATSWIVAPPNHAVGRMMVETMMPPVVIEMHTKSGLLQAIRDGDGMRRILKPKTAGVPTHRDASLSASGPGKRPAWSISLGNNYDLGGK